MDRASSGRVEEDQVGIAPDLDGALARQAEPTGGGGGDEVDHPLEGDPALGHAFAVGDRQEGLDPRRAIGDPVERDTAGGLGLLGIEPIGDVVRGDEVKRAVGQTGPQGVAIRHGTEWRRDDVAGAHGGVGILVPLLGQREVVRTRFGRDANTGRLGATDLVERGRRREVHDVDRGAARTGEGERPGRGDRLDVRGPGRRVESWCGVTAAERVRDGRVEEDGILAMDLEHPVSSAHEPHGVEQLAISQPEVEHHERLRGGDARIDGGGELRQRVVGVAADREREADVDGTVTVGGGAPFADPREERAFRRRRRAGPRVVEGQERRRATERCRDRVLEESIGVLVRGDARMRVDIDRAGEDQHPGRIDHLGRACSPCPPRRPPSPRGPTRPPR